MEGNMKLHIPCIAFTAGIIFIASFVSAQSFDPFAGIDVNISLNESPQSQEIGSGGPSYLIIAEEIKDDGTSNSDSFFQEFDVPSGDASIELENTGTDYGNISSGGYLISPTEIPLDQLNFGDYAAAGSAGSPFTPLPGLDFNDWGPTSEISFDINVPEPASMAMLGLGSLLLARRRRAAR